MLLTEPKFNQSQLNKVLATSTQGAVPQTSLV
jgi:hypothetical protein